MPEAVYTDAASLSVGRTRSETGSSSRLKTAQKWPQKNTKDRPLNNTEEHSHRNNAPFSAAHLQDDLAELFSRFEAALGVGGAREGEHLIDDGTHTPVEEERGRLAHFGERAHVRAQ